MTASRVRLVSVVWLLALLVILLATWAAMTDPRAATSWEEVVFPGLFIGTPFLWTAWSLSLALLPIAIGIAILRYRLYDIVQPHGAAVWLRAGGRR